MNLNRSLLPLLFLSGLVSSCLYPYPPNPRAPLPAQSPDPVPSPTVNSPDQQRIREARDRARSESSSQSSRSNESSSNTPPRRPDPTPPAKKDYRTATPIPGKEGFVFNPFTNEAVDVRAIPPGTLVRDPNDPDPDHKFRVP